MSTSNDPGSAAGPFPALLPTDRDTNKNTFGLVSLIAGTVVPVLGLISTLTSAALFRSRVYDVTGIVSGVSSVLSALLGIAALIFGVLGLMRRNSPKAAAGAGTALGASALLGVIGTVIYVALLGIGS